MTTRWKLELGIASLPVKWKLELGIASLLVEVGVVAGHLQSFVVENLGAQGPGQTTGPLPPWRGS